MGWLVVANDAGFNGFEQGWFSCMLLTVAIAMQAGGCGCGLMLPRLL
jgi:hypothetical protein